MQAKVLYFYCQASPLMEICEKGGQIKAYGLLSLNISIK